MNVFQLFISSSSLLFLERQQIYELRKDDFSSLAVKTWSRKFIEPTRIYRKFKILKNVGYRFIDFDKYACPSREILVFLLTQNSNIERRHVCKSKKLTSCLELLS